MVGVSSRVEREKNERGRSRGREKGVMSLEAMRERERVVMRLERKNFYVTTSLGQTNR